MRPRTSSTEWGKRVRAWRASGKSARAFADARGWSPETLRWWASRVGRQMRASRVGFVEVVEVVEPWTSRSADGGSGGVEVVLSTGRTVRVAPGADLDLLRAVVEMLER